MKHSLPEYPANSDSKYTVGNNPYEYYENLHVDSAKSYGIPTYNTVNANSLSGSYRKPLVDPNLTARNTGSTPNNSIEVNPDIYPTIPEEELGPDILNLNPNTSPGTATPGTGTPSTGTPGTGVTPGTGAPRTTTPNMNPAMPRPGTGTPPTGTAPGSRFTPNTNPALPRPGTARPGTGGTGVTPGMPRPGFGTPGSTTTPGMNPAMPRPNNATPAMPSNPTGMNPNLRTNTPFNPSNDNELQTQGKGYDSCNCSKGNEYYKETPSNSGYERFKLTPENEERNHMYNEDQNNMRHEDEYGLMPDFYNNMVSPDYSHYRIPMGVPLMPLYGYDNCEDADKDWDYMKQMYPRIAKKLFHEIEEECDKLEYDGSCMFDEYPDRVYLSRIVDRIYSKCKHLEEDMNEVYEIHEPYDEWDEESQLTPYQYYQNRPNRPHRPNRNQNRREPWLRDLIEIILFNEMLNRRRRYRGRKRWF